jgi:HK97 family phage prohead protease
METPILERPRQGRRFIPEVDPERPLVMERSEKKDGTVEFSGYFMRWGDIAHIRDFFGEYDETFNRGSFTRTFNQRGPNGNNAIKMYREHDHRNVMVGKYLDLHEDDVGPAFSARTILTSLGKDVAVEIREGVMNCMSVGFDVPKNGDVYDKARNLFTVNECMMVEGSPVARPAYESATIDNFRSIDQMIAAFDRIMVRFEEGTLTEEQIGLFTQLRSRITLLLDGPPDQASEEDQENVIDGSVNDHASRVKARLRLRRLRSLCPDEEGRFGYLPDQRYEEESA